MKKLGIIFGAIAAIALIYLFTLGKDDIRAKAKQQLEQELTLMQQSGFGIENRISKEREDHFILSFDNPAKIATYLTAQGTPATPEDVEALKGMKIGADVYYLKDIYSALSIDLYPIKLPDALVKSADDPQSKRFLSQVEKMVAEKKLFMHIDVAKDLENFKGYVKDINETFVGEDTLHITMASLTFHGKTEQERLSYIDQTLKQLSLSDEKGMHITLKNIHSKHTITGKTLFDMDAAYTIEQLAFRQEGIFDGQVEGIAVHTSEKVTNDLLHTKVQTSVKAMEVKSDQEHITAKNFIWDADITNIDINALQALQTLDPQKDAEAIDKAFYRLLEKGIALKINDLSVKEIIQNAKALGGMTLTASIGLDKSADLQKALSNPAMLFGMLDATVDLTLSKKLFHALAKRQDVFMLMAIMLVPPKENNDTITYSATIKNGKTTINGTSF